VKSIVWNMLVSLTGLMPRTLRMQFCRLLFAVSGRGEVIQASKDLLTLSEDLRWHINDVAIRYGGGVHPKHRLTQYHDYFTARLKQGEQVLDVGCGYGALAESMSRTGAIVIGVDINEKSINQANERYRNSRLSFILGDICEISLPEKVETVVLSNVLEHIENRNNLLRRLNQKLSPERFLIRVPMSNRDWTVSFRKELNLPCFNDPGHFTEYTLESFCQEMKAAGLVVNSSEVMWGELYAEVVPS
jgi:SAM-dependent methyltransferase